MPQCPHHVTQHGNERRDVFFTDGDRAVYLGLVKQYAALHQTQVLGFCIMDNHVHLVLLPHREDGLARVLREVHMRFSQYHHAIERGSGHLWQGRFYSCPVDPARLGPVMSYVERNPVRAGMVDDAGAYEWSSARAHLGGGDTHGLLALDEWRSGWDPAEWAAVLEREAPETAAIRTATYTGRPFGSDEFVSALEQRLNRRPRAGASEEGHASPRCRLIGGRRSILANRLIPIMMRPNLSVHSELFKLS